MKQTKISKVSTVGQGFRRHQPTYIQPYAVYHNYVISTLKYQPNYDNNVHARAEISFMKIKYNF